MASIADHALIGDCRSAALVTRDGTIDWLCWPRFDSPSIFAALLDEAAGGSWRVGPRGPARSTRAYAGDSNVLVTTFEAAGGRLRLTDLMPVSSEGDKRRQLWPEHELLRVVECEAGEVDLEVRYAPRPGYGRRRARLRAAGPLGIRLEDDARLTTLRADLPLTVRDGEATGEVRLRAGRAARVVPDLRHRRAGGAAAARRAGDAGESSSRLRGGPRGRGAAPTRGPHRNAVVRSLLALKLMSFAPSGAVVAAPTTSLPEKIGGPLNWDYRFCWLRDASMTACSLLDLGYPEEASAWVSWLLHATAADPPRAAHPLRRLRTAAARRGGAAALGGPPRIAPGAHPQRGGRPAAARRLRRGHRTPSPGWSSAVVGSTAPPRRSCATSAATCWTTGSGPTTASGSRGRRRGRTPTSRLLSWVAVDRLLELGIPGLDEEKLRRARDAIRADIEQHAWNPTLGTYTQVLGGDSLDASLLLSSWYGFAAGRDPRWRQTYRQIVERLSPAPGLLYRYEESRAAGEGAFAICSFWAVTFLALGGGSLEEAEELFARLVKLGNDVGLYGEEIDPETGEPLGNFPQAYTHVGLIGAAVTLERRRASERPPARRVAEAVRV
jgi:GH15 family glucan-1,4-alpha-glucosidase